MKVKLTKFDTAVRQLIALCGFDTSESATEDFVELLYDCLQEVDTAIKESHEDGLCWDASVHLADLLSKRGPKAAKAHAKRTKR